MKMMKSFLRSWQFQSLEYWVLLHHIVSTSVSKTNLNQPAQALIPVAKASESPAQNASCKSPTQISVTVSV